MAVGLVNTDRIIADIARRVGETTLMGMLVDDEIIHLHVADGPRLLSVQAGVGQRMPLHCTALGKAVLASSDDGDREQLIQTLPLPAKTESTITDRDEFRRHMTETAQRGYATAIEENEMGVTTVAVGMRLWRDPSNVYALAISGPSNRVDAARIKELVEELHRARELLTSTGIKT